MTKWEFSSSAPATVNISSWPSGSVAVSAQDTDTISVDVVASHPGTNVDDILAEVRVGFEDGKLAITGPRLGGLRRRKGLDLTIKVPAGSDLRANTASADVSCVGRLGEVSLHTASGDVTVAEAGGRVAVDTASGDVSIGEAGGEVVLKSASGDVQVGGAGGDARVSTVSGDIAIAGCGGVLTGHAISGDIDIRDLAAGSADLSAVSGDIHVTVAAGMGVYLDLASTTGSVRSELDEDAGDDPGTTPVASLQLKCRTISGDIRITKSTTNPSSSQPAQA